MSHELFVISLFANTYFIRYHMLCMKHLKRTIIYLICFLAATCAFNLFVETVQMIFYFSHRIFQILVLHGAAQFNKIVRYDRCDLIYSGSRRKNIQNTFYASVMRYLKIDSKHIKSKYVISTHFKI